MNNSELLLDDFRLEKEDTNLLSQDDDSFSSNLFSMYMKDVSKYPLLSQEEEIKYGTMLLNPENNKLLIIKDIDRFTVTSLNIPLLFRSLINSSSYEKIIDSLLKLYSKLNSSSKDEDIIYKYQTESKKLNRSLNKDELKRVFNIDDGEILSEMDLFKETKKFINYKFAFDKFFVSNLRLVISNALANQKYMDINDLINEGNLGLMKAISKFDVSLGNKFSTYATIWIKQFMRRISINNQAIVRIPANIYSNVLTLKREAEQLERELGRTLSMDEIKEKLAKSDNEMRDYCLISDMIHAVSLDQPINEAEDTSLKDLVSNNDSIEDEAMKDSLKADIGILFDNLTDREKEVINMRFGLGEYNNREYSLVDIAKKLSASPERIRQVEAKALFKMRRNVKSGKSKSLELYLK